MTRNSDPVFSDDAVLLPREGWPSDSPLPAAAVRDHDPDASPPEMRTVQGDTVFVPAARRTELERFCAAHGIPLSRRPDVWGDLLEPFLDTTFTAADQAQTLDRLARAGLGAAEVADIRERVGPLMRAYNSVHWDWHHLGLADLLDAAGGTLVPEHLRIGPQDRAAFHAWAMEIADRPTRTRVRAR
uniref:Transcriptional regulator n=1 Tax=Streptomyces sp. NBC_00049 TaxID=2903617 RepID=A0AAU2JZ20_9ACTN